MLCRIVFEVRIRLISDVTVPVFVNVDVSAGGHTRSSAKVGG